MFGLVCLWLLPMSLLKLPSVLLKFSWMMTSETLNFCSLCRSVSFIAFFPRNTESARTFVSELQTHKHTSKWMCKHTQVHIIHTQTHIRCTDPSGKQCAAVRTQQGEMRLPPQVNTWFWDLCVNTAAIQGWRCTVLKAPPTTFMTRSSLTPHCQPEQREDFTWQEIQFI